MESRHTRERQLKQGIRAGQFAVKKERGRKPDRGQGWGTEKVEGIFREVTQRKYT